MHLEEVAKLLRSESTKEGWYKSTSWWYLEGMYDALNGDPCWAQDFGDEEDDKLCEHAYTMGYKDGKADGTS